MSRSTPLVEIDLVIRDNVELRVVHCVIRLPNELMSETYLFLVVVVSSPNSMAALASFLVTIVRGTARRLELLSNR